MRTHRRPCTSTAIEAENDIPIKITYSYPEHRRQLLNCFKEPSLKGMKLLSIALKKVHVQSHLGPVRKSLRAHYLSGRNIIHETLRMKTQREVEFGCRPMAGLPSTEFKALSGLCSAVGKKAQLKEFFLLVKKNWFLIRDVGIGGGRAGEPLLCIFQNYFV